MRGGKNKRKKWLHNNSIIYEYNRLQTQLSLTQILFTFGTITTYTHNTFSTRTICIMIIYLFDSVFKNISKVDIGRYGIFSKIGIGSVDSFHRSHIAMLLFSNAIFLYKNENSKVHSSIFFCKNSFIEFSMQKVLHHKTTVHFYNILQPVEFVNMYTM